MVSKNNQWQHLQASAQRVPHYGLRKLSVGVASVLLSTTLYMGVNAHADAVAATSGTSTPATTVIGSGLSTTETTSGTPAIGVSVSGAPAGKATAEKPVVRMSTGNPTANGQPASAGATLTSGATTGMQSGADQPAAVSDGPTDPTFGDHHASAENQSTLTSNFKWTIHYTDETGKKLVPDSVITHVYTRTDTGNQMGNWVYVPDSVKVTGTSNAGWNINNPTFKFDQAPGGGPAFDFATWQASAAAIDGYTPNYNSVAIMDELPKNPESLHADVTVDGGPHEFTFVYTKKLTEVTINYVDDEQGEKVVGTGTVSGKSGTDVTIMPQLPKGYMLTPDKDVPSTYTVTNADNQTVTIHVQKQFVDLSDTDPQAKQTRTITLHYIYGAGDKQGQPSFDDAVLDVYYHRTATLDRATNQTTYGDWTWDQSQGDSSTPGYHVVSGKWTNLPQSWATVTADVPSVKGYYADLGQNDPSNTNHVPANTWVFPTYNNRASAGNGATAYLVGYGYEVGPMHTIKYVPNKTTVTVNYVDDDNNQVNVGSQHWDGTIGQHIELTLTPPANYVLTPGWVNPSSYDFDGVNSSWYTVHVKHATQDVTDQQPKDQVNKIETLTRKHLYGPGPHEGEKFGDPDIIEVPWHRTATKDLVTNKVSFGAWHVVWDEVKQLSGATKMWGDAEHNWINGGLMANHNGYSYLGVGAKTKAITTDGTVVDHYGYAGWIWIGEQDIEKNPTIVQYYGRDRVNVPVKYVDVDTNQWLATKDLTGDNYLDGNTVTVNKADLTNWSTGLHGGDHIGSEYQLYVDQTLPTTYKIDTVSNNGNLTPVTVYVVQPRTVQFTFADNDNTVNGQHPQVGDAVSVTGITGSTTPVNLMIPVGYKLVEGQQLPTTYTFVKGEQNQVILLTHQHVTVQPDAPKTPSDKLPDNPGKNYPSGVAKDDLTKTVTRKVTIVTPDGKSTVTNQTVTFTRNATVDEVTGKVTYGSWSENGKHEFATVDVPTVSGYTATGDVPSLAVTPNSQDTNVTINYTANDQTTQVVFVDDDDNGKTVDYQDIHGKTGEIQKLTDLPENYELANGQSDTITFTADTPKQATVHLKHKVVTKQLKINVYFVLERLIRYTYNINQGGETYLPWISDDELHSGEYGHGSNYKNIGSVTGSVQYDLVSGEVIKVNNGEIFKFDDTILSNYPLDIDVANSGSLTGGSDVINHTFADILNQETHSDLSYKSYASVDLTKDLLVNEELLNHLFIHKKNLVPVVFDNGKQHGSDYEINTAKTDSPFLINFNDLFKNNYSDHYDIEKNDDGSLNETAILALPIVYQAYTSKTVTRTINVISPDKTVKTIKQAAEINQNVGLDFDHQYLYLHKGDAYATDNNWTAYTVPTINGYTASQNIVNAFAVNGDTTDQVVNISYTANKQQVNINYIDISDGNKVVHTTTINGVTDGDSVVPNELPAGYKLVDGQSIPKTIHFNVDNNDNINIKVQHATVTVTPDSPNTPSDKLPDNPDKSYPSGVSENDLNKTVTRTIKVTTPDGQTKTITQTAKLTRTADVDEVTVEVKYSDWTTGQWNTYTPETVPGYSPSISEVPKVIVDGSSSDQTVAVTYTPNMQTVVITFMDQRGNKIGTPVTVSGRIGETVKVNDQVPDGWKLYAGQVVPTTITLALGTTKYDFVIKHLQSFVSFDQPKGTTDLVAGTRDIYYPSGLSKNDLTKTITRTIKDGDRVVKTQSVTFVRNAVVDVVTGEVTYLNWSYDGEYLLAAYVPTPRNGYTVDLVKSLVVTPDSKSSVVDLNYQPVVKTVTVNYVDASGKVIQSVTGVTKLTAPTGYRLMTSDTINVDDSAVNTYNVLVEPVRKTYTVHDQLPANVKDLSKVVTRTVKIEMPNGHVRTIKQEVRFERTATVDANGTVTYSDYHVIGRNSFNKVFIPHRFGYKLIFSDGSNSVAKIGNVNADAGDTTIVVKYVK